MGLTPIPFLAIVEYAKLMELDSESTDDLIYFIRRMDNTLLRIENKKNVNNGKDNTNKSNPSNRR